MRSELLHTTSIALRMLLDLHGVDSKGTTILQEMNVPYLFLHRNGRYLAGTAFLSPAWVNNYLLPHGYRLIEHQLHRKETRAFLGSHSPAVILLPEDNALLITRYEENRVCLMQASHASTSERWLTFPTLLRKLQESFTAFTLESCPPASVDVIPLLCESLQTLTAYRRELPEHLSRTVTRQDMQLLHQKFFRALMVDLPGIAHLYADMDVILALHELAHTYRHLFIIGESEVLLKERLPASLINRCIIWLQELILDRLHELGASDELLESLYRET